MQLGVQLCGLLLVSEISIQEKRNNNSCSIIVINSQKEKQCKDHWIYNFTGFGTVKVKGKKPFTFIVKTMQVFTIHSTKTYSL